MLTVNSTLDPRSLGRHTSTLLSSTEMNNIILCQCCVPVLEEKKGFGSFYHGHKLMMIA